MPKKPLIPKLPRGQFADRAPAPTIEELSAPRPVPTGLTPWKPGQSGNPSGKAKVAPVEYDWTPEALDGLARIARDPKAPWAVRRACWNDLIEWKHGKKKSGGTMCPERESAIDPDDDALSEADAFLSEIEAATREARELHDRSTGYGQVIDQPPDESK